jgi:putative ABC transport system permease protein
MAACSLAPPAGVILYGLPGLTSDQFPSDASKTNMQDLKHALRLCAKSPGFTAVVTITLALGIGANTAVFSVIYGALLRPLPYRDPGRLINILDTSPREKELAKIFASYSDFEEFSAHSHSLESIAADTWAGRPGVVLRGRGPTKTYLTIPVTAAFFKTLGVAAQMGRTFANNDLRGGCAVVLSDRFWRGRLGADPHIVGQTLSLDNQSCTVLGVMPATFAVYPPETQIWTLILPNDPRLRSFFGVFMIARLRPGVSIAQARAELVALHKALHGQDSSSEKEFTPLVTGLQDQFTWLAGRNLRTTLALLFASVILVLLIACLNIANLLLGRSIARGREFGIRVALGSGGMRLVRQLLIEAAVLSSAGGALGVLIAYGAIRYFVHVHPVELPVGSSISINIPALAFAGTVSMVTTLIFAVAPAWAISRGDLDAGLRVTVGNTAPTRQRLARMLVGAEMALSVLLLAGAGLLMRSVLSFQSAPLGFSRENILASNGSLPQGSYEKPARRIAFYNQLQQQLASLPGVKSATIASTLPPYGLGLGTVEIEGKPVAHNAQAHDVGDVAVGDDYFRLFEVALRRGRVFTYRDQAQSDHVAVVNEAFAREYFRERNPIGQRIRIGDEREWVTVIGVVGNERRPTVYEEMKWVGQPAIYRPVTQHPPTYFSIAVQSAVKQAGLARLMEKAVESIDGDAALGDIESMGTRLSPYLKYPRFRAVLLAAFSLVAILLAGVGLYGVLAQFVAQRTREVGVRMAVGAQSSDIAGLIVRKGGGVPTFAGIFVGFSLSFALTRYLGSLLYGITPTDPATFAAVAVVVIAATVMAMILPIRRALRVDPMTALRSE